MNAAPASLPGIPAGPPQHHSVSCPEGFAALPPPPCPTTLPPSASTEQGQTLLEPCCRSVLWGLHDSTGSQLPRGAQGTTTAGLAASHEGGTYFNLSYLLPPQWASDFAPSISPISLSSSPPEKPCLAVAKAETTLPGFLFIGGCPTLCAFLQPRFGPGEKSIVQEPMWVRYEAGCCRASETCQHAAAPVSTSPSTSPGAL